MTLSENHEHISKLVAEVPISAIQDDEIVFKTICALDVRYSPDFENQLKPAFDIFALLKASEGRTIRSVEYRKAAKNDCNPRGTLGELVLYLEPSDA